MRFLRENYNHVIYCFSSCDSGTFLTSPLAFGCFHLGSVCQARCGRQSWGGQPDLPAEISAVGLISGTDPPDWWLLVCIIGSNFSLLPRQPQASLLSGWGLCDGLLSLLQHTLSKVSHYRRSDFKYFNSLLQGITFFYLYLSFSSGNVALDLRVLIQQY